MKKNFPYGTVGLILGITGLIVPLLSPAAVLCGSMVRRQRSGKAGIVLGAVGLFLGCAVFGILAGEKLPGITQAVSCTIGIICGLINLGICSTLLGLPDEANHSSGIAPSEEFAVGHNTTVELDHPKNITLDLDKQRASAPLFPPQDIIDANATVVLPPDAPKMQHSDLPEPCTKQPFIRYETDAASEHLYTLFVLDSKAWSYTEEISLDIRTGAPFHVHTDIRNIGGAYSSDTATHPITYDAVRLHAAKLGRADEFADLNDVTWKRFIPEHKRNQSYVLRAPVALDPPSAIIAETLTVFYQEIHRGNFHTITYLRKTTLGYRVFYACSSGFSGGFFFKFDRSEKMIADIILNRHFIGKMRAYDRLLSPLQAECVLALADKPDPCKQEKADGYETYCIRGGRKIPCTTEKWNRFARILADAAEKGIIVKSAPSKPPVMEAP